MTERFSTPSFISGVIVGLLLAGAWFFSRTDDLLLPLSTAQTATSTNSGAVSVSGQSAGDAVLVDSVTVPSTGVWVAVREVSGNVLGNVLGATRVGGSEKNITISLLRGTVPGRTYAVELYRDDSDGAFDVHMNSVYVDFDSGAPVIAYFSTTE